MNLFIRVKSTLKSFGFIEPTSELYDGEKLVAWTTIDFFIKITGEKKMYLEKDSKLFSKRSFFWKYIKALSQTMMSMYNFHFMCNNTRNIATKIISSPKTHHTEFHINNLDIFINDILISYFHCI